MHEFQLEMIERPLPDVVILLIWKKFWYPKNHYPTHCHFCRSYFSHTPVKILIYLNLDSTRSITIESLEVILFDVVSQKSQKQNKWLLSNRIEDLTSIRMVVGFTNQNELPVVRVSSLLQATWNHKKKMFKLDKIHLFHSQNVQNTSLWSTSILELKSVRSFKLKTKELIRIQLSQEPIT